MIQGVSQDGDQCPKQVFSLHERAAAAFIHHRAFVRVSSSPPIRSFCFAICCNCVFARAYIFLIYIDMDIGGHTHIHLRQKRFTPPCPAADAFRNLKRLRTDVSTVPSPEEDLRRSKQELARTIHQVATELQRELRVLRIWLSDRTVQSTSPTSITTVL